MSSAHLDASPTFDINGGRTTFGRLVDTEFQTTCQTSTNYTRSHTTSLDEIKAMFSAFVNGPSTYDLNGNHKTPQYLVHTDSQPVESRYLCHRHAPQALTKLALGKPCFLAESCRDGFCYGLLQWKTKHRSVASCTSWFGVHTFQQCPGTKC